MLIADQHLALFLFQICVDCCDTLESLRTLQQATGGAGGDAASGEATAAAADDAADKADSGCEEDGPAEICGHEEKRLFGRLQVRWLEINGYECTG